MEHSPDTCEVKHLAGLKKESDVPWAEEILWNREMLMDMQNTPERGGTVRMGGEEGLWDICLY